ncbi:CoA-binding protein [Phormidium sp. CLA17]|uniref:succinate--CoA ligase subunit alpha n=1 Tax=Leptolyngbya sp. Cla-17 TaxID=2803751 RepID=UPI001491D503|nr:CoA-binding protein [Leptolyngbya sp. Cla-17]MBM0741300.1 CoA-binding protein [Leptolyngbya sp. Cla-17]
MNFTPHNRVLIQGIAEPLATVHALHMRTYGTRIVAGVSPGYGGTKVDDIPVFDLVEMALSAVGEIDTTIIFTHPYAALDAALEAIAAGIRQIVLITEGIPPLDMVKLLRKAEITETLIVGPNSPGVIVPGQLLLGIHPAEFYTPGAVGLISRSGTLTYEIARELTLAGLGQSMGVCIGGDAILGSSFPQWLEIMDEDEHTDIIVLVGEIGGDSEEAAAHYIAEAIDKPVIAYVAGHTAPKGRRVGHAGAIIASQISELGNEIGTAASKTTAFERAKIPVANYPSQIPTLIKKTLRLPTKQSSV